MAGGMLLAAVGEREVPPAVAERLAKSLQYMAGNLLEERHYSKLYADLAAGWDRNQSLYAALKLLEEHGVQLSPEEERQLVHLGEEEIVRRLVAKMPKQSKEQFHVFFRKLQLVVSTAAGLRQAMDEGCPADVEAMLEGAEELGVASYIMKMAVVQAGKQAVGMKAQHAAWVQDAEGRMAELVRGQVDVAQARQRLQAAQARLRAAQASHREGAAEVLHCIIRGNDSALAKLIFVSWCASAKQARSATWVHEEYRGRIERAQRTIVERDRQQLGAINHLVERRSKEQELELVAACLGAIKHEAAAWRADRLATRQLGAMQAKVQTCCDARAENAKRVVARMVAGSDTALAAAAWQAWQACLLEARRERECKEAVEKAQSSGLEHLSKGVGHAKCILVGLQTASDSVLLHGMFAQWAEVWQEGKHARALADALRSAKGALAEFEGRSRESARSVLEGATLHMDDLLLLRVIARWRLDARLEQITLHKQRKVEGKRKQLAKVQVIFREFAHQLEAGLSKTLEPDLEWAQLASPEIPRKQLSRSEGSVSLPNIHTKQAVVLPAEAPWHRSGDRPGRRGGHYPLPHSVEEGPHGGW